MSLHWASTSPKTWALSPAACLPKDRAVQKAVRQKVDRLRQVCLAATLAKVYSASMRLTALDKIHKATRSSPLLCFASCPGRQCTDMFLTTEVLTEKSRMWPDRPLAMNKLDKKRLSTSCTAARWLLLLGLMPQMTDAKVMPVVGGRCCQEVPMTRGVRQGQSLWISCFASAWAR